MWSRVVPSDWCCLSSWSWFWVSVSRLVIVPTHSLLPRRAFRAPFPCPPPPLSFFTAVSYSPVKRLLEQAAHDSRPVLSLRGLHELLVVLAVGVSLVPRQEHHLHGTGSRHGHGHGHEGRKGRGGRKKNQNKTEPKQDGGKRKRATRALYHALSHTRSAEDRNIRLYCTYITSIGRARERQQKTDGQAPSPQRHRTGLDPRASSLRENHPRKTTNRPKTVPDRTRTGSHSVTPPLPSPPHGFFSPLACPLHRLAA